MISNPYYIDPNAIREAYLNAFIGIEYPANYTRYAEDKEIESRAPGTPITAQIWNDTINELRSILKALVADVLAHNKGVEEALEEFTRQINALLQQLLDTEQAAFVEWLAQADFTAAFREIDINTCYLDISFVSGDDVVTITSPNLRAPNIFWLVTDDPATSEDEPENWRIKLDTRSGIVPDSLVTLNALLSYGYMTEADADDKYALKTTIGDKRSESPVLSDTVWGGLEDIWDALGEKEEAGITANTVWGAIEEVYSGLLPEELVTTLTALADEAQDLLALGDRMTALEDDQAALDDTVDTLNNSVTNLNDALTHNTNVTNANTRNIRNLLLMLQTYAGNCWVTSDSDGDSYYLNKAGADWTREVQHPTRLSNFYVNQSKNVIPNDTHISVETRAGWCYMKINVKVAATGNNKVNNSFVVPLMYIPEWLAPNAGSFDLPCITQGQSSYDAQLRIIVPNNSPYSIPGGTPGSKSDGYKFDKPTLTLVRYRDGAGSQIPIPAGGAFIKASVAYPLKYILPKITGNTAESTGNFTFPSIIRI